MGRYECEGQMGFEDLCSVKLVPVWKRYPGNCKGLCPKCGTEVYYDATYGERISAGNWNPIDGEYRGQKICPKCKTEFAEDAEFPYHDYNVCPLISGLDGKPLHRHFDGHSVKVALEKAIKGELQWEPRLQMWYRHIKGSTFSFEIAGAEFENQDTKPGDDIIMVTVALKNGSGYGKPCSSIKEAVDVFEYYYDQVMRICWYSNHACNKKELWKIADSFDGTQCPHVCCRRCNTRGCSARCNGAPEPKVRQWHRCSNMLPEKSGYYEIMDIDGNRGRAWFEKGLRDFDHVTKRKVEAWGEEEKHEQQCN